MPSIAGAQYSINPDADYMRFDVKGWMFCPVTNTTQVQGFLAYLIGDGTGANVQLVWYERVGVDSWSTWAWQEKDLGAAVWYVRSILADDTAFTRDLELNDAALVAGPESAKAPKPMSNGLFFDDPIQPVVQQSSDPGTVLDLLEVVGWQVAPSISQMQVGNAMDCNGEPIGPVLYLMRDLTNRVEDAYFASSTVVNPCQQWPCTCTTTFGASTPTPPGTWTVTPVTVGNRVRCSYSRPATRSWSKAGKTWFWCNNCANTGSQDGFECGLEDVDIGTSCPPAPDNYSFTQGDCGAIP